MVAFKTALIRLEGICVFTFSFLFRHGVLLLADRLVVFFGSELRHDGFFNIDVIKIEDVAASGRPWVKFASGG
jgi:hypothetical protein